ncbi:LacI family transcriptional regulator [Actinosynnema sp. ALI-1.44]|uniref:LacI family DNA-binding transcriptional regulator n=1 Tax=Actinosynnema sp. ALI-1.44 TaxID=1933779 RepID=UPI00097C860C|nr:LacI family DNA-binding transcriptional regulator [Actinosynnema sp. ALI-1.44]ONI74739.1 LacI family transcriptional regulator [Actinosynnema sp. ALI-1.44]
MSKPSARTPTLEDVARVAGVSRATVSRVINGIRNVDSEIQETVREAIRATGYAPNQAARSLVTRRAGTIVLVMAGAPGEGEEFATQVFGDPFFGRVAGGVVNFLRNHGIHPVLMLAETGEARTEVIDFLRRGNADGALLVSTHPEDPLPRLLIDAGLPAVLFARPARPVPISYVDTAHQAGAELAADHLVSRGRTKVATICGPLDVPAAQARLAGFQQAMDRHGYPYIPIAEGDFTQQSGETAMARLLTEHPDLDGVFAANDLMAHGAVLVLQKNGRRVPEDVAVVGYDNSPPALASRPRLTTVVQPVEEMVAEMARILLDRIESPEQAPRSVVFDPALVVREST